MKNPACGHIDIRSPGISIPLLAEVRGAEGGPLNLQDYKCEPVAAAAAPPHAYRLLGVTPLRRACRPKRCPSARSYLVWVSMGFMRFDPVVQANRLVGANEWPKAPT